MYWFVRVRDSGGLTCEFWAVFTGALGEFILRIVPKRQAGGGGNGGARGVAKTNAEYAMFLAEYAMAWWPDVGSGGGSGSLFSVELGVLS